MTSSKMKMTFFISFLILVSDFSYPSDATVGPSAFRPKALVLPITKDPSTSQYITHIKQRTPLVELQLVVDLGGQFLWVDCEEGYVSSSYKPARCGSPQCSLAVPNSKTCIHHCYGSPPMPDCNNNTCHQTSNNHFNKGSADGEVAQDVVSLHSTDGTNPRRVVSVSSFLFTCAPTDMLEKLAKGSKGMAGLGRSKIGLPSQFGSAFGFPRKFAVCLGSHGVVFLGDGPYNFLSSPSLDVSKRLKYTPLIFNPVSTAGVYVTGDPSTDYFISVTSILVANKPVKLNATLLAINSNGKGGTKLSTVDPFTVLETSIYRAVISEYRKSLAGITTIPPVSPFGLCYSTKSFHSTLLGLGVPQIDLVMSSNVTWSIFGGNSMVHVRNNVVCLGIVDGGVRTTTSIVIGAHQLEDNLLQFDLAASRLGFSSLLWGSRTTCSNFNFTSVA